MCPLHEQAWFDPEYRDTIRVIVNVDGSLRPIFWFSVGEDHSVYVGPRVTRPTIMKSGASARRTEHGVRIDYSDGDVLDPSESTNPGKISFHQSGIVNASAGRSILDRMNSTGGHLLAHLLFRHPRHFEEVPAIRKKDVVLNLNIEDDLPIFGRLVKIEGRLAEAPRIAGSELQVDLTFEYAANGEKPELTLLLTLYAKERGPWPPQNYIVWPTEGS